MRKQKGATFVSWVAGAGAVIFVFITIVKLAPVYVEFHAVRSFVNEIAARPDMLKATKQQIIRKVDDYLNVNGLYTLSTDAFSVETPPGKKTTRVLAVNYEVRKHWLANIDFLMTFSYSAELGKAGDT